MIELLRGSPMEKPWGRTDTPWLLPSGQNGRIGEIWYENDHDRGALPLKIKHIFTSEKLSIQVHPNDAQAQRIGQPSGKDEAWFVIECEPGATIGVGMTEPIDESVFRAAVAAGELERWIDWKPVSPGDFLYIPAGTIHAVGAGISMLEIQRNVDITYRLFDYGRPRELHLEQGLEAGKLARFEGAIIHPMEQEGSRAMIADQCSPFWIDEHRWPVGHRELFSSDKPIWFMPTVGAGLIEGQNWSKGQCWLIDGSATVETTTKAHALVAGPRS